MAKVGYTLRLLLLALVVPGIIGVVLTAPAFCDQGKKQVKAADTGETPDAPKDQIDERTLPTHEQVRIVKMPETGDPAQINTFCLDNSGNLLVARGGRRMSYTVKEGRRTMEVVEEPSQVSLVSPQGKLLKSWPIDFRPQAINVAEDGAIFVAGDGRVARLDRKGKILAAADTPPVADMPPVPSPTVDEDKKETGEARKAREEKAAKLTKQQQKLMKELMEVQKSAFAPDADEDAKKEAAEKQQEVMTKYQKVMQELREAQMTPEIAAAQAWSAAVRQRSVTGIAATGDDVFICCSPAKGYGYEVWRTDRKFGNAKKIVKGLRGCCGQMDIQAYDGQLYVPENGRKQVARYDRDGKELARWGSSDRKTAEGFGSCCNPMNIRIGPGGEVVTSESNVGRIKRFDPDGKFLGVVGTVKIIPGCKHVAVGVGKGGKEYFLLDITRSHVVVLAERDDKKVNK